MPVDYVREVRAAKGPRGLVRDVHAVREQPGETASLNALFQGFQAEI